MAIRQYDEFVRCGVIKTEPVKENHETETKCDCDHKWEFRERYEFVDSFGEPIRRAKYRCAYCGKFDVRDI